MTDLQMVRGDSRNYQLEIFESDGATPVDVTGGIIKFAAKRRMRDPNSEAQIFKTSYDPAEIQVTDAVNGQALLKILVEDTVSTDPGTLRWDVELTRRGALLSAAGTWTATAGSNVLTGVGIDFSAIHVGDILVPAGVTAPNQVPVTITALDSVALTAETGSYESWDAEAGISHQIFTGNRKTPDGLSGCFVLLADVVI